MAESLELPVARGFAPFQAMWASMDPEGFFARCQAEQGDPFCVVLPGAGPLYLTADPEGVEEIFRAPHGTFEPVLPNPIEPMLGPGSMILLGGARHRRERKLLTPPFHGARMRAYGELIRRLTLRELSRLTPGETFDARTLTQSLTLAVILRAIFGIDDDAREDTLRHAIERTTARYGALLALVPGARRGLFGIGPWDRFQSARDALDALLREEVAARRASEPGEDILSLLLSLRYEDGEAMSDDELLDELRTMLVAGHETAATGMAWALGYVHHLPEVARTLGAELAGADRTPEALAALPYLSATCNESLRRHPVVPIVLRRVVQPFSLRGHEIPVGAGVGVALTLLHTRADLWSHPDTFHPAHFLERKYTPFEFAPFGGGARRCLGAAFATYEMKIALGTLLGAARFEAVDAAMPAPVTRSITMSPRAPIRLRLLAPAA